MAATTVRLPEELDAALEEHCAATGAVKNRVVILALRSYLMPSRERELLDQMRDKLGAVEVER